MKRIGFSHNYSKLHGQTQARLIFARTISLKSGTISQETYHYDTDGKFDLPDGEYIQLVFLGNKQIPFTTYRRNTSELRTKYMESLGEFFEVYVKKPEQGKGK